MPKVDLYCGDCLDILPTLAAGSVDAVVTDPPYGISWDSDYRRMNGGNNKNHGVMLANDVLFDPTPWLTYKYVVLFGYQFFASRLPAIGTILVWDKRFKNGTAFLGDAELGWCKSQYKKFGGKNGGVGVYIYSQTWQGFVRSEPIEHPTQKPVGLMMWAIRKARIPSDVTILDPYMGSGTTGVACVKLGRNFIGIEKEPRYFEAAKKRIEEAQLQMALPLEGL